MKKVFYILLLGGLALLMVSTVSARSSNAAIVIHNDSCLVPDGSGSLELEDLWEIPNCCDLVETFGVSATKKASCHAQLPPEAEFPDKTLRLTYENTDGFECWWDLAGTITTDEYLFTITPSGKVNFHCMFRD